jgi:hypothetical protein
MIWREGKEEKRGGRERKKTGKREEEERGTREQRKRRETKRVGRMAGVPKSPR